MIAIRRIWPFANDVLHVTTMMTWLAVLLLAATAWFAAANLIAQHAAGAQTKQSQPVQSTAETVLSTLKDAETGQRGYLLTGDLSYLEPYMLARERLNRDLESLAKAPVLGEREHSRIDIIRELAAAKMVELNRTVTLFQLGMAAAALELVRTNEGRRTMEAILAEVEALQVESMTPLAVAAAEDASLLTWAPVVALGSAGLLLLGGATRKLRLARPHVVTELYQVSHVAHAHGLTSGLICSPAGRILYWSPGAERLYGYRSDQAVGQIGHQLLRTCFPAPMAEIEESLLKDGFWQGELTQTCRGGEIRHVNAVWAVHRGHARMADAIIQTASDISALKRVEAELAESQVKLRLALDAADQGLWQWDIGEDNWTMVWDDRCKAIFGLAAEAPVGFQTWADTIGPEQRSAIKAVLARAVDPAEPDDRYMFQHHLQQGARGDVWITAAGRVLFQPDPDAPAGRRPVRSFGIVRDISQTRHQEEDQHQAVVLLRAIVEASSALIYAKDRQGRMLLANASVMNLIGKPWDQVRGRTDAEFLDDPAQAEAVMLSDRRVIEQAQTEKLEEMVTGQDGQARVWASTKTPLVGPDGRVIGLVGMSVEITEQKRSQDRLCRMVNELNHRVKNTLATVLAISSQSLRGLESKCRENFEARMLALASAHDVLSRENWEGAALRDVVAEALMPFDGWNAARFWISGPPVRLRPNAVLSLLMGLHELASNAFSHGALSGPSGRVQIRWEIITDEQPQLRLLWREHDGPAVVPPAQPGFGMRVIERSLVQNLRGTTRMDFSDPQGLICEVKAPLGEVATLAEASTLPRVGRF